MTLQAERPRPELYLLTPSDFDIDEMATKLEEAFEGGDIACVQLRMKGAGDGAIIAAAKRLMPIAHSHDAAFIINDRADIAAQVGADGVHLGQNDGDIKKARDLLGFDKDIGITCHDSRHLAFEAGEAGADYVAFGAFFPTKTKTPKAIATPDILTNWAEISEIPSVAIGGITAENCATLVKAHVDLLAVCNYVWSHKDGPGAAITALNEAIDAAYEA